MHEILFQFCIKSIGNLCFGLPAAPGPGAIPPPPQPTTLSTPDELSGAAIAANTQTAG